MVNAFKATVESHDTEGQVSWLSWQGMRFSVPLVADLPPGSAVQWTIPSDQIRLLTRGTRTHRLSDTPFTAKVLDLHTVAGQAEVRLTVMGQTDAPMVMTLPGAVAERLGIGVGSVLVARLRGENIQLAPTANLAAAARDRWALVLATGAGIGTLGGLIGLGGAEFRLPLLIGLFGFAALHAVILNKAMSLIVVAAALVFRTKEVPVDLVLSHGGSIVNLLAGSLVGAWLGAGWATRLRGRGLYQVIAVMLVGIAAVLLLGHGHVAREPLFQGGMQMATGVAAGLGIGIVASVMGVAGGELLIPTLVILFGVDIKLAGSLSLAISLPTMVVGFLRYSQDGAFDTLRRHRDFVWVMATGSILGTWLGGALLGVVSSHWLLPMLSLVLVTSAVKVWQHR